MASDIKTIKHDYELYNVRDQAIGFNKNLFKDTQAKTRNHEISQIIQ